MSARRRGSPLRTRVGKVSVYAHHGALVGLLPGGRSPGPAESRRRPGRGGAGGGPSQRPAPQQRADAVVVPAGFDRGPPGPVPGLPRARPPVVPGHGPPVPRGHGPPRNVHRVKGAGRHGPRTPTRRVRGLPAPVEVAPNGHANAAGAGSGTRGSGTSWSAAAPCTDSPEGSDTCRRTPATRSPGCRSTGCGLRTRSRCSCLTLGPSWPSCGPATRGRSRSTSPWLRPASASAS